MSEKCKDIMISCAIVAVVAAAVSYKVAELVFTIAGYQNMMNEPVTEESANVIGFAAPSEGDDDE